jgi:hypothetical protein
MNVSSVLEKETAMGFTVARRGGTKDVEFAAYARLLRRRGVILSRIPRTLEPGTGRRWLYVWDNRAEAEAFAGEMKKETRDEAWYVQEVNGPPSEGPLGPIEIQIARQSGALLFAMHPFSRRMVQALYPGSCNAGSVLIETETREEAQRVLGDLTNLAGHVALILTGLKAEQLERLGYSMFDRTAMRELAYAPPLDGDGPSEARSAGGAADGAVGASGGAGAAAEGGSSASQALR